MAAIGGAFARAIVFGAVAALGGAIVYAIVGLSGFMVSIVAIGVAWLIAKAMMAGSNGIGGRPYQVAAVILTYFAVNLGELLAPLWRAHAQGLPLSRMINPLTLRFLFLAPFLQLSGNAFNGILGAIILLIGMRAAWQMTSGGPVGRINVFGRAR